MHNYCEPRNWIAERTAGKTFADIGGLWSLKNEMLSTAIVAGATEAVMIDIQPLGSPLWLDLDRYMEARQLASYRCVTANAASFTFPTVVKQFDIIHCSGIAYHLPSPFELLRNLHDVTREFAIITSMTVPERIENEYGQIDLGGGGAILLPSISVDRAKILERYFHDININYRTMLSGSDRGWRLYPHERGWDNHLQLEPGEFNYAPWWWIWPSSTFRSMLATVGFEIIDEGDTSIPGAYSFLCKPGHGPMADSSP